MPGFVNAHSHLEYAVYAGLRRRARRSRPGSRSTSSARRGIGFDEMVAIARAGAADCLRSGITTTADYSFAGAAAPACADARPARDRLPRGLRAATRERRRWRSSSERARASRARSRSTFGSGSRRTRRTPSRADVWEACAALGLPVGTHLAESRGRARVARRTAPGRWPRSRHLLVEPTGETGTRARSPGAACSARTTSPRTASTSTRTRSRCSPSTASGSRTVRARTRCSAAGSRRSPSCAPPTARVGLGTDSPASTPSFDMFDELRTALIARARARSSARTRSRPGRGARARDARLGPRARASTAEIGSLVPGKRADLAVVSLAGSPYLPWEDPAAAVVLGGAPSRVLLTLVEGQPRYRRGGTEWHELTDAASRARSRLLHRPTLRERLRRHRRSLLPAPPRAGEVDVRLPRARLRRRLRRLRRRLRRPAAGVADIIGVGGGGAGQPSVDDARERLAENPDDAQALRDLATALQTDGQADEAIVPLEQYVALRAEGRGRAARARRAST